MNSAQRLGIFGGTFDPIHNTHVAIARAAGTQARLDTVLFVVAARPPHKGKRVYAAAEDRLAMVEAALAGQSHMAVSRLEFDRQGPSYTVDTLDAFGRQYPGADLFLILGYDSLVDLPRWRDPRGILARAHVLVAPRPGVRAAPAPELEGRYTLLDLPAARLSSTTVRQRIAAGAPVEDLVPPGAARIIHERGLYHAHRQNAES